ncbi:MAG: endonuclease domain-containing protein [Patescibacteria group bacterium]
MYEIFNKSKFLTRRRELRKSLTPQELKLWFYLKNNKLGVKFRRQHGIGPYIVDFYCKEKNLVIEIDGSLHKDAKDYDKERNAYIETLGLKVLRFWNSEIDKNIEGVLKKIKENLLPLRRGSARRARG